MTLLSRLILIAVPIWLLTSCVTYPYASSFSQCDAEAGACYRYCEYYEGTPDYRACHADCEYEIGQCFDAAYAPYHYAGSPYGPSYISPWYGTYGAWYPSTGYAVSMTVIKRYGYSPRKDYDRNRRTYSSRPSSPPRSADRPRGRNSWDESDRRRRGEDQSWRRSSPQNSASQPSGQSSSQPPATDQYPRSGGQRPRWEQPTGSSQRGSSRDPNPAPRPRSDGYRGQGQPQSPSATPQSPPAQSAPAPVGQPSSSPQGRLQPSTAPAQPATRSGDDVQRHDD